MIDRAIGSSSTTTTTTTATTDVITNTTTITITNTTNTTTTATTGTIMGSKDDTTRVDPDTTASIAPYVFPTRPKPRGEAYRRQEAATIAKHEMQTAIDHQRDTIARDEYLAGLVEDREEGAHDVWALANSEYLARFPLTFLR